MKWLALRARAAMLERDAETAVATLQRAIAQSPNDPDLLVDLGVAYAVRAGALNQDRDYGNAVEYLRRSLKAKHDSREAVFNLALIYGVLHQYEDAEREWRHYLELDVSGAWRDEAQRHLFELERQKESPEAGPGRGFR